MVCFTALSIVDHSLSLDQVNMASSDIENIMLKMKKAALLASMSWEGRSASITLNFLEILEVTKWSLIAYCSLL